LLNSLRLIQLLLIFTWLLIPIGAVYIQIQKNNSDNALVYQSLKLIAKMTSEVQKKYSVDVISKINDTQTIRSSIDHVSHKGVIPVPATFAIELAEAVSNKEISVRMYSKHPFKGREQLAIAKNIVEEEALEKLIAGDKEFYFSDNKRFLYVKPVIMVNESCVNCHNNHPESTFREWKLGDVRSALIAEMQVPISSFNYFYLVFFILLFIVIATLILLLNKLSRLQYFKEKAITDELTGLYNRTYINKTVKRLFNSTFKERSRNQGVAVIIVDFDHFKQVNDQYGHATGDLCLQKISSRMLEVFKREQDIVVRYGGDEFLIYSANISYDNVIALSEKVLMAVSGAPITQYKLYKTLSIGFCHVPSGSNNPSFNEVYNMADQALYEAKKNGRNKVVGCKYSEKTT